MSFLKLMPKFKVVEPMRSTGLLSGHMLSQFPAAAAITTKTVGNVDVVENGLIVGLNHNLEIGNYDKTVHKDVFIVFTEELSTVLDGNAYFANMPDSDGKIYVRAVALKAGDVWNTNNYLGTLGDTMKFAKAVNGVITLQTTADEDTLFAVKAYSLATGEVSVKLTFLGDPKVGATGPAGPVGPEGPEGPVGPEGPAGPAGV